MRQEFENEVSEAGATHCACANIASVIAVMFLNPRRNPWLAGWIVYAMAGHLPA